MSMPAGTTADDLDRWAARVRRKIVEIMSSHSEQRASHQAAEVERANSLRSEAARKHRDARRLQAEAAKLQREADQITQTVALMGARAAPGVPPPKS
jgi:hypothetical protein